VTLRERVRVMARSRDAAIVAAAVLLAIALFFPRIELPRDTFTYMVTFDITQSMQTEDMTAAGAPVSRLAFAKATMREALTRLPCGSKIGWSIFTGQATLPLMPPIEVCRNFDALLASLEGIDGRMRWTNWSRIAEGGIYSSVRVARELGRGVEVVFFTDGQEAPPILPSNSPEVDIAVPGVGGWLIGVGGDQPAPVPKIDADGNHIGFWGASEVVQVPPSLRASPAAESHEELSALQGEYLAKVAARIGFSYRRLSSADSLARALRDVRFAHRERVPTDVRRIPAMLALIVLVGRYLASLRFRPWRPRGAIRDARPDGGVVTAADNGIP